MHRLWRILTFTKAFQQATSTQALWRKKHGLTEVRWCFSFQFKWLIVHDPTKVIFRSLKEPYLGCIQCHTLMHIAEVLPRGSFTKRNASFRANLILERLVAKSFKYQWVPRVHHLNWKGFLNVVRLFWGWVFAYAVSIQLVSTSIVGTWNVWWLVSRIFFSWCFFVPWGFITIQPKIWWNTSTYVWIVWKHRRFPNPR